MHHVKQHHKVAKKPAPHVTPKRKITTKPTVLAKKQAKVAHSFSSSSPLNTFSRGGKISAADLRVGYVIEFGDEKKPYKVVSTEKKMMGRRPTSISLELKCLTTGKAGISRMMPTEMVESFDLEPKTLTFLYTDGEIGSLMDPETFDQHEFAINQFFSPQNKLWLPADQPLLCYFYNNELFSVNPPEFVQWEIKTVPLNPVLTRVSGNDYKHVIMANDQDLRVPVFMDEGQKCKIRFEDCSFVSRVNV